MPPGLTVLDGSAPDLPDPAHFEDGFDRRAAFLGFVEVFPRGGGVARCGSRGRPAGTGALRCRILRRQVLQIIADGGKPGLWGRATSNFISISEGLLAYATRRSSSAR